MWIDKAGLSNKSDYGHKGNTDGQNKVQNMENDSNNEK